MKLADQVHAQLSELRAALAARRVAVVHGAGPPPTGTRALPLGGGARLEVELGGHDHADDEVDAAMERAVRALRDLVRTAGKPLPDTEVAVDTSEHPARVAERIHGFLDALLNLYDADNVLVTVNGDIVASARPVQPLEAARVELLVRRTDALAHDHGSAHGDLADPDAFVTTFWYGAALILYFGHDYAVDFVRHRARMVARELTHLLPDLDPDPVAPAAAVRPPP